MLGFRDFAKEICKREEQETDRLADDIEREIERLIVAESERGLTRPGSDFQSWLDT